jgi:hypothetical protein
MSTRLPLPGGRWRHHQVTTLQADREAAGTAAKGGRDRSQDDHGVAPAWQAGRAQPLLPRQAV